jgi:hypothetical protein
LSDLITIIRPSRCRWIDKTEAVPGWVGTQRKDAAELPNKSGMQHDDETQDTAN